MAETSIATEMEHNRLKGFLGTADELTAVAQTIAPNSVAWVKSLTDEEIIPLSIKALGDIADNVILLDELRQRFRKGLPIAGYGNWKEFIDKHSKFSIRTIQNRLAEVNGKDESKVNHAPGNMYTRTEAQPFAYFQHSAIYDSDTGLPRRWSQNERSEPNGCTLPNLRARIKDVAQHFEDPFVFLGLTQEFKIPTGETQAKALKTRKTLDIPAQWKDLTGKICGTTNVQWQNGQLLNRLISAIESGAEAVKVPAAPVSVPEVPIVHTYPVEDYEPEQQVKAARSRSHGKGLERLRELAKELNVPCSISHDGDRFRVAIFHEFDTESAAREFLNSKAKSQVDLTSVSSKKLRTELDSRKWQRMTDEEHLTFMKRVTPAETLNLWNMMGKEAFEKAVKTQRAIFHPDRGGDTKLAQHFNELVTNYQLGSHRKSKS